MDYGQAIDFLYTSRASFERDGVMGYKPGLETTLSLSEMFGAPHRELRAIHVAGTNGKGSVSHLLASILAERGLKVGLYTSPHFVDFNERVKINGTPMPHDEITRFVDEYQEMDSQLSPSFFELTTVMAFRYFVQQKVDVAVVETGLGGRLDSTNIIMPDLSVITNVSYDHTDLLGNSLAEIAGEKAGIIKRHVPVVVGMAHGEVREVLERKAEEMQAPIIFAQDAKIIRGATDRMGHLLIKTWKYDRLDSPWAAAYQVQNINTALAAVEELVKQGYGISGTHVKRGVANVDVNTGFTGRWSLLSKNPTVICDSGHNVGALSQTIIQLKSCKYKTLRMVMGFMADKDVDKMLSLMPTSRTKYYFTQAHCSRAMDAHELQKKAIKHHLSGECYESVAEAFDAALSHSGEKDMVFVGGSMYVLAELLAHIRQDG